MVTASQISAISIAVPASATPGDYNMIASTTEGGQVPLTVSVVTAVPDPFISSFSTYATLPGGSFYIYGYGFGTSAGQINVDTQSWTVESWSDDLIQVAVPSNAQTGLLRVRLANGRISNGITFGVKNYGFQIQTEQTTFQMQGGDQKTVGIQLTGYQQPVNLTIQSSNPQVHASLDQSTVTPVSLANLTLAVDKNIPNGTYNLTLSGSSGVYQTNIALQVIVGSALTFTTTQLPVVLQETNYAATLTCVNAVGTPTYSLVSGVFPQGLSLDPTGVISGRATEAGRFRVVLQVADSAGHSAQLEFQVHVQPTGWFTQGRDEGRSWYSPVDSPADSRTLWSSAPLGSSASLLAGANEIFLQASNGVSAFYATNGSPLFEIHGSFSGLQFHRHTLVGLGSDGTLHVWETGYGNQIWQQTGVSRFWVKPGVILADTGSGQILVLDAAMGTLRGTVPGDLTGTLVGWRGQLYRLQGKVLQLWSDTQGWSATYTDPAVNLTQATGDGKGLYLVGQDGSVKFWNGSTVSPLWTGSVKTLVVSTDWLAVDTGSSIEIRDRNTGSLVRTLAGGGYNEFFGAADKLFAVQGGVLSSINLTSGSTIWQAGSQVTQAVIFGDQVYAVDSQGIVTDYNAPDDILPPVTTLVTVPAQPDGLNGWYITSPQISLVAESSASYIVSTQLKLDTATWETYQSPITLTDGLHSLVWYSSDAKGLQEATKIASLSVDASRPVTTAKTDIAPLANLPGVWGAPVQITLTATEAVTGVAQTVYSVNGGAWQVYSGQPITLTEQGFYTVTYHSQSKAGGWESVQTMNLALDYYNPSTDFDAQRKDHAVFVFLTGHASPVGLDHLEYKIEVGGSVQTYTQAVPFTQRGKWQFFYRAVDKAGRSSDWQSRDVHNEGTDADDAVGELSYSTGKRGHEREGSVHAGSLIFSDSRERFLTLPPVLNGALYLRGPSTDAESTSPNFLTVPFKKPVTVYYLEDPASPVVLPGWTKGDFVPPGTLSAKYFSAGLQIWTKTFQAGQSAVFAGSGLAQTGGNLVFIQVTWSGLEIVSPAPEQEFFPGQSVSFEVYTGLPSTNLTWSVRDANAKNWSVAGTGASLSYTLSPQDDGGEFSVKVEATVGGTPVNAEGDWKVLYQEKLKIIYPSPDYPAQANAALKPQVVYTDAWGKAQPVPVVTWTLIQGGKILYTGASPIPLGAKGDYQLNAAAKAKDGANLADSGQFRAHSGWPWVSWHWFERRKAQWHEGENGFEDHDGVQDETRQAITKFGKAPLHVWTWNRGARYRLTMPNGTYEVRVIVGPFHAWYVGSVLLNNQGVNVEAKKEGEVDRLRFVVKIANGTMIVQGTEGLPFYRFEYRKMDEKTPPSAAVVGPVDTLEDLK
jgi:hypothetical protein